MALTSGGLNWRRKRGNAERLQPVAEDANTTTQLFSFVAPRHDGLRAAAAAPGRGHAPGGRAVAALRVAHGGR